MSDYNEPLLLTAMEEAAHAVGEFILHSPVRTPAASTSEEIAERFHALDEPGAALLRERLAPLRPQAAWAEEFSADVPARGEIWVVDPLDGAVQYLQDMPYWSVSVTLVRDRMPVAAVLHSPVRAETYTAAAGRGARRNGRSIEPSRKGDLSLSVVGNSQPSGIGADPGAVRDAGLSLSAVLPHVAAVRNLGPTSWQVADAAAGRLDAFWQYGVDDSNLLGAALIAQEAGMVVTDLTGRPWQAGASGFLAAPTQLHARLLPILAPPTVRLPEPAATSSDPQG